MSKGISIWALSDLHLAFGAPEKSMEIFGSDWKDYPEKIASSWKKTVCPEDLVLIPGDISWAMNLKNAIVDLEWIDALPGTKCILRGNHDYWWGSHAKLSQAMPPTILFIHNNALLWNGVAIGGTRLWDTDEYRFDQFIEFQENPKARVKTPEILLKEKEEGKRIFARELERLKLSLSQLDPNARLKIALTHYPPIGADLQPSSTSKILEDHQINYSVFGHLHRVRKGTLPFGKARNVSYLFTSCDYLDFVPMKVITF